MTSLEQVPPKKVGERLRVAREAASLKQADAASAIGVARTTIVAIEQGERRVRMGELQKLAQLYGTSVNALLRREGDSRRSRSTLPQTGGGARLGS